MNQEQLFLELFAEELDRDFELLVFDVPAGVTQFEDILEVYGMVELL